MDPMDIAVGVGVLGLVLVSKYNEQITFLLSSEFHQALFKASLMLVPALLGSALVCLGLVKVTQNLLAVRRRMRKLQQDSEKVQSLEQEKGELLDKLTMEKHEKHKFMNELKRMQEKLKDTDEVEEEEVNEPLVRVHGDKPLYMKENLNDHEVEYLLEMGYEQSTHVGLDSNQPKEYLLKQSSRESPEHIFFVHIIAEYLRQQTNKVRLFETTKPDIVFSANGQWYAIEVETGVHSKDKPRLKAKVKMLNEVYGQRWFFVVTSSDRRRSYRRFGRSVTRFQVIPYLDKLFR